MGAVYPAYDAPTVTGKRGLITVEAGPSARTRSVIGGKHRTRHSHRAIRQFGDIGRAEFLELVAYDGSDAAVLSDSFFLDPLESDSDEWDFGRHKHVIAAVPTDARLPRPAVEVLSYEK